MKRAPDDIVHILMKLTSDVERFDSLVVVQRKLLQERGAHPDALDDGQLSRQAERLNLEAAEIVAHARQALHELRHLSEVARPPASYAGIREQPVSGSD
jgi:hypothetical protein